MSSQILEVRNAFTEGVYEAFTSLFNDGVTEGLELYLLNPDSKPNIYGELKDKTYLDPIRLVCNASIVPEQGEQVEEGIKESASFKVPLKSFQLRNLEVDNKSLETMRKGVISFNNVFYQIDNIKPRTFVAGAFYLYEFQCKELKDAFIEGGVLKYHE